MTATDNGSVKLTITVPAKLMTRIDGMVDEARRHHPYRAVSRSGLVQHMLAEHIALIDTPERADRYPSTTAGAETPRSHQTKT